MYMRESGIPPQGVPRNYAGSVFDPPDVPEPPPPPRPPKRLPLFHAGDTDLAGWLREQAKTLLDGDLLIIAAAVFLLCTEKESDDGLLLLLLLLFLVQ